MLVWRSKDLKYVVHVKLYVILDWGVGAGFGRVVGFGVVICISDEVDCDVGDECGEGFELYLGVEFGSSYVRSWRLDWFWI